MINELYDFAALMTSWRVKFGAGYWVMGIAFSHLFGKLIGVDIIPSFFGGIFALLISNAVLAALAQQSNRRFLLKAWTESAIYLRRRDRRRKEAAKKLSSNVLLSALLPSLWIFSDITRWTYYNRPLSFVIGVFGSLVISFRVCSAIILCLTANRVYESDIGVLSFVSGGCAGGKLAWLGLATGLNMVIGWFAFLDSSVNEDKDNPDESVGRQETSIS